MAHLTCILLLDSPSRHLEWNNLLVSLSLHLRGRAVTKGTNIKSFVKSQPLFDVHWQNLLTFLTDLQVEVSRFRCLIFHFFCYFLRILLDYLRVLFFISYILVIVLYLESFRNNLFELVFSISKKACFYGQTFSRDGFFARL